MEHIEHVFSYIIPGLAPRGRSVLAAFLQSFLQKYVFHVFCVFSQRKFANVVCSVICSNVSGDRDRGLFHLSFAPLAPLSVAVVEKILVAMQLEDCSAPTLIS